MVAIDVNAMFIGGSILVTGIAIFFLWLNASNRLEKRREESRKKVNY